MYVAKPPMGWNTWNTFGHNPDEKLIIESTDAMVELGYKDVGYEYIIIDDFFKHFACKINKKNGFFRQNANN